MNQPDANTGRRRGRRVSSSLAEINVVPLVDVMLVLLIIFMVAAPMMQKGVEVNLPVSRRADKLNDVRTYITVPLSYRQDHRVQLDQEMVPIAVLGERARQMVQDSQRRDVFLRGDGAVTLQELMEVFGVLKGAGVEKVGIIAQERRQGQ